MSKKVNVSMSDSDFARFDRFCSQKGFKKSPLIVRLIREFMNQEGFVDQPELDISEKPPRSANQSKTISNTSA